MKKIIVVLLMVIVSVGLFADSGTIGYSFETTGNMLINDTLVPLKYIYEFSFTDHDEYILVMTYDSETHELIKYEKDGLLMNKYGDHIYNGSIDMKERDKVWLINLDGVDYILYKQNDTEAGIMKLRDKSYFIPLKITSASE